MKKVIAAVMCACICYQAGAATEWKLKKENDHLKIYTAAVEHSAFKSVRVECVVKGTFSQIIAALYDIDRQKEWVFNDKYSKLLKRSANELIYYSEVNVPWPCTNRDFVAHLTITQPSPNVISIASYAEPNLVPEKDGIVRIKSSVAQWTMTAIGGDRIKIDYTVQFDPGGSVPAWLTNMFVVKGPYETFEKLQGRINMPAYRNARYEFIKE
jgi:hypothetical protein